MIRFLVNRPTTDGKFYAVIAGLSTDAKPTASLITGSRFVEADTGTAYLFNETASTWNENQQLTEAVQAWLDDHPEAIDQAAIEAMFGDQLDGIENMLSLISTHTGNLIIPEDTIADAAIDSSGVVVPMGDYYGYALHVAPILVGRKYTFLTNDASRLYGFFSSVPEMSSVTYNNSRVTDIGSGALTITAPITGYIAFRSENHYATPIINEGNEIASYTNPYTAYDEIARTELEEIEGDLNGLKSAVADLEEGSLSAIGASAGQVPTADGNGSWTWATDHTVTGANPVIVALAGHRYICGEVETISITPPASGICDVTFTSGTTPAVLTVPNTVKWPEWFNPASLAASTTYELNIMDGTLGVVSVWT